MWISIQHTVFIHFNISNENQGLMCIKATQFLAANTFTCFIYNIPDMTVSHTRSGAGEFFLWADFRLSLWNKIIFDQVRMRGKRV